MSDDFYKEKLISHILEIIDGTIHDDREKVKNTMEELQKADMVAILEFVSPLNLAHKFRSNECRDYFSEKEKILKQTDGVDAYVHQEMSHKNEVHLVANPEMIELLTNFGNLLNADINLADENRAPLLLLAVKRNYTQIARYLIRNNAAFDIVNESGESSINIAIIQGQEEIVKEILNKGEKDEMKELFQNSQLFGKGHTILYPASFSHKDSLFDLLLKEIEKLDSDLAKGWLKKEMSHQRDSLTFRKGICSSGMLNTMKKLIDVDEYGKLALASRRSEETTPLMWAAEKKQYDMLRLILEHKVGKDMIERQDRCGRNVLHFAAAADDSKDMKILNHLKESENFDLLNVEDKYGCTPDHHAAVAGLCENVWLLLGEAAKMDKKSIFHCKKCVSLTSIETMQKILQKYRKNDERAFRQSIESYKNKLAPIHVAARVGRIDILKWFVEDLKLSAYITSRIFTLTVLHHAVLGKSNETVKFLIEKFPNMVNEKSTNDETPAVLAAERGYAQILKSLLDNGAKVFGDSQKENLLDCVTRYTGVVNREKTGLEIVKYCHQADDKDLMKKVMENAKDGPEGIMSTLLEQMPKVAYEILNGCKKTKEFQDGDQKFMHSYSFFPVQDRRRRDGKCLLAIESMLKNKCYDCLGHPVVIKFVDKKWNRSTTRLLYTLNIFLYILYLLCFTTYCGLQSRGTYEVRSPRLIALSVVSLVVIAVNIMKELFEMVITWPDYFFKINNYVEWTMYASAIIYLLPLYEEKDKRQIELGAIAVFIAWINLIWFFKRFSLFGIYVIMAKKVFFSLLKVLPMVILFIVAFSMAFFLLMKDDKGYSSIPVAMMTTVVMMVGEIDYRDEFLGEKAGPHHLAERVFFICFLLIITIVIMNLLIGLAVGDTEQTMKRSLVEKRFYKAGLMVHMERTLTRLGRVREVDDPLNEQSEKDKEKKKNWFAWIWFKVYQDKQLNDPKEGKEILSKLESLEKLIGTMEERNSIILSALEKVDNDNQKRSEEMEKSLGQIMSSVEKLSKQIEDEHQGYTMTSEDA